MVERWFRRIELPLSFDQFLALPQNRAYKYEYYGGRAVLSPRPKAYRALLELRPRDAPAGVEGEEDVTIRPLVDGDWVDLPEVFSAGFHRVQPFASLDDEPRRRAAARCLRYSRVGEDGPLVAPACFVAADRDDGGPLGAILITLMPDVDPEETWDLRWKGPPPPDCLANRLGRPHLTWIFVAPLYAGHGIGTALLAHAGNALLSMGYRDLASTFLLGNDSSMLWHWRSGFRLLAYPGSMRRERRRLRDAPGECTPGRPLTRDPAGGDR